MNGYFSHANLMDLEIVSAKPDFNFKTIALADPQSLNAGFYFTQLSVGEEKKSLCLQLPECLTKQGMVTVKNGKYLDLMFERSGNDELTHWLEQLEYTCQDIIDTKKDLWFQTELTRDDIETMMTQVTRLYQSGKYMLMRVFVETLKSGSIAYDENEIAFDLDILEPNKAVIPLIMIEGVKFSSRSFEISLKLVQVMVMGHNEKKKTCLIKRQTDLDSVAPTIAPTFTSTFVNTLAPTLMNTLAPTTVAPHTIAPPTIEPPTIAPPTIAPTVAPPTIAPTVAPPTIAPPPTVAPPTIAPTLVPKENAIEEVNIDYAEVEEDSIFLKNPNDVYYELYKKAREKAKQCRIAAIEAYLEAKQIKTKYMLFDEEDSDDLSDDDIISDEED
jgi:arsenate reductase-like glutaredoxin family protein